MLSSDYARATPIIIMHDYLSDFGVDDLSLPQFSTAAVWICSSKPAKAIK
jgi:hypothetical protein